MADIRELLAQAAGIIKGKIAVIRQNEILAYPEAFETGITYEEASGKAGKNFRGMNIYRAEGTDSKFYVCISADKYYESESVNMLLLLLISVIDAADSNTAYLKKAIEGNIDASETIKLEESLKDCLPGYLLLVDGYGDSGEIIMEILTNSMEIRAALMHKNRIVAISNEENVQEACGSFVKNVLSELLMECSVVIGGKAERAAELHQLHENCVEALRLKYIYSLCDSVLNYDALYGYRIAYNLEPRLKEFIKNRVFTAEFEGMVSGELGITVEEFFKNNLNLTDTAAKLYIHRNTLLYRLDKIMKSTGYDLKKFEDSWLFKLAWMLHKEKSN